MAAEGTAEAAAAATVVTSADAADVPAASSTAADAAEAKADAEAGGESGTAAGDGAAAAAAAEATAGEVGCTAEEDAAALKALVLVGVEALRSEAAAAQELGKELGQEARRRREEDEPLNGRWSALVKREAEVRLRLSKIASELHRRGADLDSLQSLALMVPTQEERFQLSGKDKSR
mmetsp:Transcript_159503/g.507734  ORF Transcript_159503/g.507734 Transcript_159503/m.507734 type:complete len:177 (-) Transcript_159503:142-672(-)